MTQAVMERAENAYLLIVQDMASGKRKVISIPFNGVTEGYEAEGAAVQLLMGLAVE